jgi:hypothetical protein
MTIVSLPKAPAAQSGLFVAGAKKERPAEERNGDAPSGELSQKTEVAHFVECDAKGDPNLGGCYADTDRLRHIRGLT